MILLNKMWFLVTLIHLCSCNCPTNMDEDQGGIGIERWVDWMVPTEYFITPVGGSATLEFDTPWNTFYKCYVDQIEPRIAN